MKKLYPIRELLFAEEILHPMIGQNKQSKGRVENWQESFTPVHTRRIFYHLLNLNVFQISILCALNVLIKN